MTGALVFIGIAILLSGPSMTEVAKALTRIAEALERRNRVEESRMSRRSS